MNDRVSEDIGDFYDNAQNAYLVHSYIDTLFSHSSVFHKKYRHKFKTRNKEFNMSDIPRFRVSAGIYSSISRG